MSIKTLVYCLVILIFAGQHSYGQSDSNSKEERKYHNKQNSKFVSQVKSIQEKIQLIRHDDSLSDSEKRIKIRPLFDEMKQLREANVANRRWQEKEEKAEVMVTDVEDKQLSKDKRKRIKGLQKEINRIKKDDSLTEAEKRAKLDPIHKEMIAIKTGKAMTKDVVTTPTGRVLKTDVDKKAVEEKAQEKWKADRAAKRKANMEKELASRKEKREKARAKREKNIESWKAKARQEKEAMEATQNSPVPVKTKMEKESLAEAKPKRKKQAKQSKPAKPVKAASSKVDSKSMSESKTSKIMNHDPSDINNEPIPSKSAVKKVAHSGMLKRLTAMSDNLTALKNSGSINSIHFEKKMAHIRKLRERFLRP